MGSKWRKLLWVILLAVPAFAQSGIPTFQYVTSAPTGSCAGTPSIQIVYSTGAAYSCNAGTWGSFGGGSGGGAPTGPAGGSLTGTYPNPTFAAGTVAPAQQQFSVTKYGAVCDGSTNDATAIQAAIAAAAAVGGNVVIPAATCNFATTLTRPRNVMIFGQGRNSSYLNYTGSTRAFVLGDTGSNNPPAWKGGFQHVSLEGPSATGSTVGIYMGGDPSGTISPTGNLDDDEEWLDFAVQKFGLGVQVANNAYLLTAVDFLDATNNQLWKDISTNTNSGERMSFVSSIFGQSQSASLYAIELDNNLGDYYFLNSSIDYNNASIADVGCLAGNMHATFTNVHFEKAHGERIHINNTVCNGEIHVFGGEMTTTGTGTTDNDMIGLTGSFTSQNVVSVIGTAVNSNETLTQFIDANNPSRQITIDSLGWENFGHLNACVNNEGNPIGITVRNTQGCTTVFGDGPPATVPGEQLASIASGNTYAAQTKIALDPRDYGADFNGHSVADASTTNGSNVVTCPNSDCNFPSTIAGYIIFATAGTGSACLDNASITFGSARQTTVATYTNANSITVTGNSNATATATACLAWFPIDSTTALTAWWLAGGCSGSYVLPAGMTLFSSPIMQNLSGCLGSVNQGYAYPGQTVKGAGTGSTFLVPAPNFTYTGLAGNQTINCAVGNLNIEHSENFAVWGLGERATGTLANVCLFMDGQASSAFRIDLVGWDARGGGAGLYGLYMTGVTDTFDVGGVNYFGGVEVVMGNNLQKFENNYVSGNPSSVNAQCGFLTAGASSLTLLSNSLAVCTSVTANSVVNAFNNTFAAPGDTYAMYANGGAVNLYANSYMNGALDFSSTGSKFTTQGSYFGGNIIGAASNTFLDLGGNTFAGSYTGNSMTYNKVSLVTGP